MAHYRKVVFAFLLASLAAILLVAVSLRVVLRDSIHERLQRTLADHAGRMAGDINGMLEAARRDLEFLAAQPAFAGLAEDLDGPKRALFDLLLAKDKRFSALFVLTPEGDRHIAHPAVPQGISASAQTLFRQAAKSGQSVISDGFTGADGLPAVAIDLPILGPDGAIVAHLGGVPHLGKLSEFLDPQHTPPFPAAFLLDARGQLIAHTDPAALSSGERALFGALLPSNTLSAPFKDPRTGIEYLAAIKPVSAGWRLALLMPRITVAAEEQRQVLKATGIVALIILAVSGLGLMATAGMGRRWNAAEAALRESEEKYRTLFETAPDAVLVHQDGRILFANPALATLIRAGSPAEVVGLPVMEIVHPDLRETVANRIAETQTGSGEIPLMEQVLLARDGHPVEVEAAARRITVGGRPASLTVLRDIGHRNLARREQDRFFEISPDLLCIADTHGYFRRLTARWTEVLGWSLEEMTSRTFMEFVHPDDMPGTMETIARLRENKRVPAFVNRFRCKNGSHRWLEWTAHPEKGETIYAIARDITVRKIHEAEIHRLSRRLDLILRSAGEGVCGMDSSGRAVFMNPAASRMLGWLPEELIGQYLHGAIHHSHADGSTYHHDACPMNLTAIDGEVRHVQDEVLWRKDGTRFPAEYTVTPIGDDGKVTGAVVVFRDVTERRAAEEALARHHALLESIGRIQTKFIGQSEPAEVFEALLREILRLSGSAYGFVAESSPTPWGEPCQKVIAVAADPDDESACSFIAGRWPTELRFVGAQGLHMAAVATGAPTIANDPAGHRAAKGLPADHPRITAFLGLPLPRGKDILGSIGLANRPGGYDEQLVKFLEPVVNACAQILDAYRQERLRETMARDLEGKTALLEASNNELQAFAYVASHDLQEPLRMVTSYMQMLERRYAASLDDQAREFIGFAVDGARRMQRLIKDLLEYSRVGTRGKPFQPTALEDVVKDALANLTVAMAEAQATVTHDPLPLLEVDEVQMVSLFQNLIGNAIKYRRQDGTAPAIHVSAERVGLEWVMAVRDNGIGIEPQHFARIFMVFQRLHGRAEYEGTGIGLAVCKKIVERHGGRIWVDSVPGEGSTFYFSLPAVRT